MKCTAGCAITLLLSIISYSALATQDHTCQGGHNCEGQGQGQVQGQGQSQVQITKNRASSDSSSRSGAIAIGGKSQSSSVSNVTAQGGQAGQGGVATVNVSVPNSRSAPSETSLTTGETNVTLGETVLTSHYDTDYPASTPAAVYTQVCQSGASGQVAEGGFAVTQTDAFCQAFEAAIMMKEAHIWEVKQGNMEKAGEFLTKYHENLALAQSYVEADEIPARVDNFFSRLIRPVAVIAALIFII